MNEKSCKSFKEFNICEKCIACEDIQKCNTLMAKLLPFRIFSYSGIGFLTFLTAAKLIIDWADIIKDNSILASIIFIGIISLYSVFIFILLFVFRRKLQFYKDQIQILVTSFLCKNKNSCNNLPFKIDPLIMKEITEFQNMLELGSNKISSRADYLKTAKDLRSTEVKSYHVLYLTKNSLEVYKHEDWLDKEETSTSNRRQRIIIIDNSALECKTDTMSLLNKVGKSSNTKIVLSETIEGHKDKYGKLLKDFGLFVISNGKMGLFTVANIYNLDHAKHVFCMLTENFYSVHNQKFLDEYEALFLLAWQDDSLHLFDGQIQYAHN